MIPREHMVPLIDGEYSLTEIDGWMKREARFMDQGLLFACRYARHHATSSRKILTSSSLRRLRYGLCQSPGLTVCLSWSVAPQNLANVSPYGVVIVEGVWKSEGSSSRKCPRFSFFSDLYSADHTLTSLVESLSQANLSKSRTDFALVVRY
jgi:hypothetical protein